MILKCLNPEKYYKEFAEILNIHEEDLFNKELLSAPEYDKETLKVNDDIKQKIIKEYNL